MALKLGSLFVSLSADVSGLSKGMAEGARAVDKMAKQTKEAAAQLSAATGLISGLAAAAVKLASTVDGQSKAAIDELGKSTNLLAVQVADVLLPAVQQLTSMFRTAAAVVAGMSPETRAAASHFAVMAVETAAAAKGLQLVAGVASTAATAFRLVFSIIGGIGIGALLEVVAVIAAVALAVAALHRTWRENWGGIQEATKSVIEWFTDAFGQLGGFLKALWVYQVSEVESFVDALLSAGEVIESITGKKLGVAGLKEGVAGLFKDLKSGEFVSQGLQFGKTLGESIVDGVSEEFKRIGEELGIDKLMAKAKSLVHLGTPRGPAEYHADVGEISKNEPLTEFMKAADEAKGNLRAFAEATTKTSVVLANAARLFNAEASRDISKLTSAEKKSLGYGSTSSYAQASTSYNDAVIMAGRAEQHSKYADAAGDTAALVEAKNEYAAAIVAAGAAAREKLTAVTRTIGGLLLNASGALGRVINNISSAFQQGGPWAALVAAILEVFEQTQAWADLLKTLEYGLKRIGEMASPLVEALAGPLEEIIAVSTEILAPAFKGLAGIFSAIGSALEDFAPILEPLGGIFTAVGAVLSAIGTILNAVFVALKPLFVVVFGIISAVATIILGIVRALEEVWNAVVEAVASFVGLFDSKAADEVRKGKADTTEVDQALEALKGSTYDSAAANAANTSATWKAAAANDKNAAAASKFAESFQNVPSGYKIKLAQFNAIQPGDAFDYGTPAPSKQSTNHYDSSIHIANVNITSTADGEDTWKQMQIEAKKERSRRYGNPYSGRKAGIDP